MTDLGSYNLGPLYQWADRVFTWGSWPIVDQGIPGLEGLFSGEWGGHSTAITQSESQGCPVRQPADAIFTSSTPPSAGEVAGKDELIRLSWGLGVVICLFKSESDVRNSNQFHVYLLFLTVTSKDTMDMVFKFSEPQTPQLQNEEKNNLTETLCRCPGTTCSWDKLFLCHLPQSFLQLLGNRIIFAGIPWTNILMEFWIM